MRGETSYEEGDTKNIQSPHDVDGPAWPIIFCSNFVILTVVEVTALHEANSVTLSSHAKTEYGIHYRRSA